MRTDPGEEGPGRGALALLALLTAALYGAHLGDGYFGDDFLYLGWLDGGLGELLRRVTVDSLPQMIRPLPALAWCLAALPPWGTALHHALSLLLHALAGWLVARLVARTAGAREAGLFAGALFVAFPLFTEPVIWLSAAPDLWACVLALLALDVGLRTPCSWRATAGAAGLFALSLLSKETTVVLPLVALCFTPWYPTRRLAAAFGGVAALYLAVRFLLFGGIGGYLDESGSSLALRFAPATAVRNALLQLPFRLLFPLKQTGELPPWLDDPVFVASGALTLTLAVTLVVSTRVWHRPRLLAAAGAAYCAALLPVAPVFGVGDDHENGRLLYFPIAAAAALGGALLAPSWAPSGTLSGAPRPRLRRAAVLGLLVFWGAATAVNGRTWSEAARERRQTLAALAARQGALPAGHTVLLAGHEVRQGVPLWINGFTLALERAGLRRDVHWIFGTAALVGDRALRDGRVSEIGPDAAGAVRDWTACQRALRAAALPALARQELDVSRLGRVDLRPLELSAPATALAVTLHSVGLGPGERIDGVLFWRHRDNGGFNLTDARRFRIHPGRPPRTVVRLPQTRRPQDALALRLELSRIDGAGRLVAVEAAAAPPACGSYSPFSK